MNSEDPGSLPPAAPVPSMAALPEGRFSGRIEFADMVRLGLAQAAARGWREVVICDPDFEDWPLGERVCAQALQEWSRPGRKLTMLARNYDEVVRRHARFVTWRRTWAHIIECRGSASTPADDMPSALWSPQWVFERLDKVHSSGIAGAQPARRVLLRERLNELLLKSTPAFPANTLGL